MYLASRSVGQRGRVRGLRFVVDYDAVDGGPGAPRWDPQAQRATVACLLELGADADASDKQGTTPLLRAIRNRCADAVDALIAGGADVHTRNKAGSTARELAEWTTGRGGSGSPAARAEQQRIIDLLSRADGPGSPGRR